MKQLKNIVLSFDVSVDLLPGIHRLRSVLPFTEGDGGIRVTAVLGNRTGVSLKDGVATIYYSKKNLFFRELSVLIEQASEKNEFDIVEDGHFTCLSTMLDTSRNGVPTLEALYRLIDRLVLMGYDTVLMYMEDTVKLENYQYFGYMRGAYTTADLKALDDYAFEYGIEVMPCIECYGHMEKYLIWPEAQPVKDTERVLLAREEKTFALVEEIIRITSSCFRSKRIHVGMDEAWHMGRGGFLDKHGYVPPFEIFNEYMERLMQIVNKYGLTAMMWSDMYFRNKSPKERYYDKEIELTEEDIQKIPEGIELVFWHYGEKPECDNYMLEKHIQTGKKVIFAGGLWSWIGHFPEHNYTMEATRFSLNACRKNNVREAMATVWLNDNAECPMSANLFGLSFFAELCFDPDPSKQKLRDRFEVTSGGDYDAFYTMSLYHNTFTKDDDYSANFHTRFLGKPLFWQDVLNGLFDTHLFQKPMSRHYAECEKKMAEYRGGEWNLLYRFAEQVFAYLAVKTEIAEQLHPAYHAGDRATLKKIANELLPALKQKTTELALTHRTLWMEERTMTGWCHLDVRYAGVCARCDTAICLLNRYLDGTDAKIDELEEVRLHKPLHGFTKYGSLATPNLNI